jgi:hypothetical protein
MQSRESMLVAASVGFRVWPRNVAQAEPSALVRCRGGFDDYFSGCLRHTAARKNRRTYK